MAMKIRLFSTFTIAALIGVAVLPLATAATPTVSATLKAQLIYIIQEEKLARDVLCSSCKKHRHK